MCSDSIEGFDLTPSIWDLERNSDLEVVFVRKSTWIERNSVTVHKLLHYRMITLLWVVCVLRSLFLFFCAFTVRFRFFTFLFPIIILLTITLLFTITITLLFTITLLLDTTLLLNITLLTTTLLPIITIHPPIRITLLNILLRDGHLLLHHIRLLLCNRHLHTTGMIVLRRINRINRRLQLR